MKVLILNAGSSSQKSSLYDLSAPLPELPPRPLWQAQVDWTHPAGIAELRVKAATGAKIEQALHQTARPAVVAGMLETLWSGPTQVIDGPEAIAVVGHRVVHGGQTYRQRVWVTAEVKAAIARLATFAPLHNPANLEGIEAIEQNLGVIPQVAVFDTAFHADLPPAVAVYPGPYAWFEQGIQRYGFHGISHEYCAHRAAQILRQDLAALRLITCHLGNGCSLTAIREGRSINTTMGFTPLEGLMMGSRSGSIDPGILIHLLRRGDYTVEQLDQVLNQESGLKGISGVSADLRQIMTAIAQGNPRAQLALEIYVQRLRSQMGAMLASLGGLDVLVFTAGVGENSAPVRAAACEAFSFLGLKLDPIRNAQSPADQDIATADSAVRVLVIHTQEDWAIAKACWELLNQTP